jgi:hypothetical protein
MKVDINSNTNKGRMNTKKQISSHPTMKVIIGYNAIYPKALSLKHLLPKRVGHNETFLSPNIVVDFAQVRIGDH